MGDRKIALQSRQRSTARFVVLVLAALAMEGCGRSQQATVSGKVTIGGKPVTAGTVLFVGVKNQIATGKLDGEGRYVAPRVPMGSLKVAVQTLRPEQVKERVKNFVPVPQKYADPETSGLTCEVNQSQQEYNIDLQ